jgi:CMP-2-keto-3-deoxyoctulosonic acid synthetase
VACVGNQIPHATNKYTASHSTHGIIYGVYLDIVTPAANNAEDKLGVAMPTLYQEIANKFLTKLSQTKGSDAEKIEQLRVLLADGKKVKPDDFVKIFSVPAGGDIK